MADAGNIYISVQSVQDLTRLRLDETIVRILRDKVVSQRVLRLANFPLEYVDGEFGKSLDFWSSVFESIENGIVDAPSVETAFAWLLRACNLQYPSNSAFLPWRDVVLPGQQGAAVRVAPVVADKTPNRPAATPGIGVLVEFYPGDHQAFFETASRVAASLDLPAPIEVPFATAQQMSFFLPRCPRPLAEQFAAHLQGFDPEMEVRLTRDGFRDYLFAQVFIACTGGQRLELNDVPASSTASDLGIAVYNHLEGNGWPLDEEGLPEPATVDHVVGPGRQKRLGAEVDLDQADAQDGDTFNVNRQSTAASIITGIREEALAGARAQIQRFATQHPELSLLVKANAETTPTQYIIKFNARSWAPPQSRGGSPVPTEMQIVLLYFPDLFPMQAPVAQWRTPIFHPNIHPETGSVCLGALREAYVPGTDIGSLCSQLVDMARYRNYDPRDPLRHELCRAAADWAFTPEGQALIESRGGRSVTSIVAELFALKKNKKTAFRVRSISDGFDKAGEDASCA